MKTNTLKISHYTVLTFSINC